MRTFRLATLAAVTMALFLGAELRGGEPTSAAGWLEWFAVRWDESELAPSRGRRYMRTMNDQGWQARMRALQGLAASGSDAIVPVSEALGSQQLPTRLLAAQALGFLAPNVPREPLIEALERDTDPAVRLYAADSLGRQGGFDLSDILESRRVEEANRDTKKHLGYALERKQRPIDPAIIESLIQWDNRSINSAQVGQPAPDFQLHTISGTRYRLSDFRGKQPVVLVFIYGDT